MKDTDNKQSKLVIWICDKDRCGAVNTRNIPKDHLIFDDKCDYCDQKIHEPIVDEVEDIE